MVGKYTDISDNDLYDELARVRTRLLAIRFNGSLLNKGDLQEQRGLKKEVARILTEISRRNSDKSVV